MSGRIVGETEISSLAFPFEVTARPKRAAQPNQQRGVPPGEHQAFMALVVEEVLPPLGRDDLGRITSGTAPRAARIAADSSAGFPRAPRPRGRGAVENPPT
ncbi:MAG TPA: hypothetical protein VN494_08155 [Patescibacteria group bacterium]|nr:hypothetical protein [Patescibacteria group bacterium]